MTLDELRARLKAIRVKAIRYEPGYDPEVAHEQADDLLLAFIDDVEVSEHFNAIEKWYS